MTCFKLSSCVCQTWQKRPHLLMTEVFERFHSPSSPGCAHEGFWLWP